MTDVNWEMIIFIIIAGLVLFAGLGIFIGTRISADKKRIRELEGELSAAKKELETYRISVNDHFKKTSELFSRMTDSYKAVYLHLAEGARTLCTNDAALLKPAEGEFMKLGHAGNVQEPGKAATAPDAENDARIPVEPAAESGGKPDETAGPRQAGRREDNQREGEMPAGERPAQSEPAEEEQPGLTERSEDTEHKEKKDADEKVQRTA